MRAVLTCKSRAMAVDIDWGTGRRVPVDSGKRVVVPHPNLTMSDFEHHTPTGLKGDYRSDSATDTIHASESKHAGNTYS